MTTPRILAALNSARARQGQYVSLDPMGRVCRVSNGITSFAATTYQLTIRGWARVC